MIRLNFIKYIRPTNIARNLSDKPKSPYKLLEKTEKIDIAKFSDKEWAVPEEAKTFKRVRIGRKDNPDFERDIVTFYNEYDDIIECCRRGTDWEKQRKIFEHIFMDTNKEVSKYGVNTTRIKTLQYSEKEKAWKIIQEEEQHVSSTDTYIPSCKKLANKVHINKNIYDYSSETPIIHATMTEYPLGIPKKQRKEQKKFLGMDIVLRDNRPEVLGYSKENNVEMPTDDEFLPYRFLVGDNKLIALARYCVDKRGLAPLNIKIKVAPEEVAENAGGHFDYVNGNIVFKCVTRHIHPIEKAAEEAEHAYQFSLIGRSGHGETEFEKRCFDILGSDLSALDRKDGVEYYKAKLKYPILNDKEDASTNKEYTDNLLEEKGHWAGRKMMNLYNEGKQKLHNIFKYVQLESSF